MNRTIIAGLLLAASAWAIQGAIPADAASLPDLAARADLIVRVRVHETASRWVTDAAGRHIWTTAVLEPLAAAKGRLPDCPFQLTFVGGTVGDVTEVVTHSLVLAAGEEALLFLAGSPYRVIGGDAGKMGVFAGKVYPDGREMPVADFERALAHMLADPNLLFPDERCGEGAVPPVAPAGPDKVRVGTPNLTPYQPGGWSSKVVVSTTTGTSTDNSPLYDTSTLYIDWAIANLGDGATSGTFYNTLYLDGTAVATWTRTTALNASSYTYVQDYALGSLAPGDHTLQMVADATGAISESNETDNSFSRIITVQHTAGTPVITQILPGPVPAGTGSEITLVGLDFGATQGAGKVEFFYRSGQPKIAGTVLAWSDTRIRCTVPTGLVNGYNASAASGPVTVTSNAGTTGPGFTCRVMFGNGGYKWSGTFPIVNYLINENTTDTTGEGAAIQLASSTWNVSGVKFGLNYAGTTTKTTSSYDGENIVAFGATGGSLATTTYWVSGTTMLEADQIFNDVDYNWSTAYPTPGGSFDIRSIALHEFGHYLNLRDQYGDTGDGVWDTGKIMFGMIGAGVMKWTLQTGDLLGLRHIYLPYGDANGDAGINATDLNLLAGYLAGSYGQGQNGFTQPVNADVDGNTTWNARDLTTFILFLNGSISTIPRY